MTTPENAPLTDRTLPAPWAECEVCGGPMPALPDLDGDARCPECTARARLNDTALEHLAYLLAPILGAWAHHYTAQGATPAQLYHALTVWAGGDLNENAQRERLTALIQNAMTVHTPPVFTPAPPDRVQLDARTLPQVLDAQADKAMPAADGPGQIDRRLSFKVRGSDGRLTQHPGLGPGRDVVLILNTNAEHDALLYYTGIHGKTQQFEGREPQAYRVPARLLPQVRAALGYTFTAGGQS